MEWTLFEIKTMNEVIQGFAILYSYMALTLIIVCLMLYMAVKNTRISRRKRRNGIDANWERYSIRFAVTILTNVQVDLANVYSSRHVGWSHAWRWQVWHLRNTFYVKVITKLSRCHIQWYKRSLQSTWVRERHIGKTSTLSVWSYCDEITSVKWREVDPSGKVDLQ